MEKRLYFSFTDTLVEVLDRLAEPKDAESRALLTEVFPELGAIFESGNAHLAAFAIEHESYLDNVLYDHIRHILVHKLGGVERRDIGLFQSRPVLDDARFAALCRAFADIDQRLHLAPVLRAALVFSDISKGGSPQRRSDWKSRFGMDLGIHNEASALFLQKTSLLHRYAEFRDSDVLQRLVILMVRRHGLIGQYVRGEIPASCIATVAGEIRALGQALCEALHFDACDECVRGVVRLYWLMNVLDTAAVHEALMTDDLYDRFERVAVQLENAVCEKAAFPVLPWDVDAETARGHLAQRLAGLRGNAIAAGESPDSVCRALDLLDDERILNVYHALYSCSLWYFEAATGRLSAESQLKALLFGIYAMCRNGLEGDKPCHLDYIGIASSLSPKATHGHSVDEQTARSRANYRVRILDAIFASEDANKILDGTAGIYRDSHIFAVHGTKGGESSLSLQLTESEESDALITLLSIYERKSTVAFHSALKMLCDLYGLRKDDFDRLSNESQYLVTMNAAKHDKARMMRYLKPGRICEVGPGGGVVLDLLAAHFPDSEIIGLDASHQVVVSLEQRKKQTGARWNIIEGNAFDFLSYFEKESLHDVVFCSILHEIYSYIEADDGTRFHLESVERMLKSAFDALMPGGRILIRDGIMPEHEPQLLTFLTDDAREFFDAFCREFKGRNIEYHWDGVDTVRIDSADAMEFMYTYTWGPESFPYEVREQYGIMTYPDYCRSVLDWLGPRARLIEIPADEALVLQPGYVTALQEKVRLRDASGKPAPFPPSNAILVIEKI